MKKLFMLCSVIIALAIIVTAFTACGDKTEDETTTTTATTENLNDVKKGFTIEITKSAVEVYYNGNFAQSLAYPADSEIDFDLKYAKAHSELLDMNFDGKADIYVAYNSENGVISYYCWLYNVTTERFDYSESLSALKNISVDAENHRVYSKADAESSDIVSYHWVDGVLTLVEKDEETNSASQKYDENTIGTDKKPVVQTEADKSDNANNSSSSNKDTTKENITTTAPNSNIVVLGTGDLNDDGWF